MEARAGRQHLLGAVERLEQLGTAAKRAGATRRRASRAAGPTCARAAGAASARARAVDVLVERVLEVELALVAQLHDRRRGERLRDRAEAVLRVGRRLALRLDVGRADRGLPDDLAVAEDGGGDARQALVALLAADEPLELGREGSGVDTATASARGMISIARVDVVVRDVEMRDARAASPGAGR